MVALHATDPASVYLSAMARLDEPSIEIVANALYEERSVVRVLAMRRTLFVAPVEYIAVIERSSTDAVAENERKRLEGFLADSGIDDPRAWLTEVAEQIVDVLPAEGLAARELTAAVPVLSTKIVMGAGTKNSATAGATSRVLAVLANEGLLMRGRPAGRWTGRQYRWHLRRHWLGSEAEPAVSHVGEAAPANDDQVVQTARTELVGRWLRAFGPAPFDDVKWWTGWTVRRLRAALDGLDVVEVDLHGETGLVLADDLDDDPTSESWVALLPSLDPTPMGWKHRDHYLGPHREQVFDRFGNIGPTIWVDGRIVGGWGQRPDGTIVTSLLEDVGSDHRAMIDARADSLTTLIDNTVVKPSFPTPLQKQLAS